MRFSASVLLASLVAMASAAPVSPVENALEKRADWCGSSTFINNSSGGSPQIADCQQLAANIVGDGRWSVGYADKLIAKYGTCSFNARISAGFERSTYIGNEDLRDLIRDSIARFAWQGKVGASGVTDCNKATVTWGIFHS
ncbi:putative necrosis-inducing factor-domain-containing protein [Phaeosphaeria sp. MPI-PUGE-AT-0046c]|nr:putative necrosis-inducing factor-domain-containing protein [Phaeosphaeria sp. MPI-PUGE-AT-0046c]